VKWKKLYLNILQMMLSKLRLDKFLTSARYFFKISCDKLRHVIVSDSFSPSRPGGVGIIEIARWATHRLHLQANVATSFAVVICHVSAYLTVR